ncbi:MAG: hypothetical protein O7D91_00110 [Planctomycetota bacterium]|nr:hypothetical protein [Planctomycetota bacterium]
MSPQLRIYECSVRWQRRAVFAALCIFGVAGPGGAQAWGQWEQTYKLTANDATAGIGFGFSVSISGGIPIVGVPGDDNNGSAYLFEQSVLCPADLNGDGVVGAFDLAILLGSWGTCLE